jgi:DNA/RNA-binding domain of Phe-tRNA-synthetase-like protein
MTELHFRCEPGLFETFPDLTVFAVRVAGMKQALANGNASQVLAEAISNCTVDPEMVAEDTMVAAWREAYGLMGVKPSKFRSSIEALLRRASKRAELELPVGSVNLYNACSISHRAALGAYDAAKLPSGSLELRRARPATDRFEPLGAEASAFPLTPGLVVYAAGDDVLCWGFNSRDSKLSALDENSDAGIFFAEAAKAVHVAPAQAALEMLKEHFASWGAVCGEIASANSKRSEFVV